MLGSRQSVSKTWTIWVSMVAVALIAGMLGLASNEAWRWGYPRKVPFDHETAIVWLERVIRQDYRMYDYGEVWRLIGYVMDKGLLLGKTRAEVSVLLGPPPGDDGDAAPVNRWARSGEAFYTVGSVPPPIRAHPPVLLCHFGSDGKCDNVRLLSSD